MRLHRFYIPEEIGTRETITLTDSDLVHQLRNVFRMNVGGQAILFDNSGYEYHVLIASFEHGVVTFSVASRKKGKNIPEREVYLFCSLIKKDHFEWVLEKGTELGVSHFVPLLTDRSEKKNINVERAQKILLEASEQSGRVIIPTLAPLTKFEDALENEFACFAFHPEGDVFTINHTQNFSPLGLFIGPEGGFTEREIFLFKKNNVAVHSLGSQILRAETAAVAVSSLILLQ